jgi:soluble lytic murein transglycosylase
MLTAPRDRNLIYDTDEWWVERRLTARKLLDIGDPRTAYRVAAEAVPPQNENKRGEHEFTAGWIALRFLHDPAAALAHFARVGQGTTNPITLARASYWQGRAAEAAGRTQEAHTHYEAATRFPTAYYGQLARARLGHSDFALRRAPAPSEPQRAALANLEVVRAVEILYAVEERDLIVSMVADIADKSPDVGVLLAVAELTARHEDARSMLQVGKTALGRGFALDHYAFPHVGVPKFSAIAPEVDRSVIFSIIRQESAFNQKDVSTAQAVGLMQITPEAGRHVAKKWGVTYDFARLRQDPVYNCQIGAAEIAELMQLYRGNFILAFAAYNAGQGRVREWVARYGDPRDPNVDPIDWVERIPFAETRNYVQRVTENVQVYRMRFEGSQRLLIEADLRRGATANCSARSPRGAILALPAPLPMLTLLNGNGARHVRRGRCGDWPCDRACSGRLRHGAGRPQAVRARRRTSPWRSTTRRLPAWAGAQRHRLRHAGASPRRR